jgi:hypothetical protein
MTWTNTPSITPTPTFTGTITLSPTPLPALRPMVIYPNPSNGVQPTLLDLGLWNTVQVKIKVFTLSFRKVFEKDCGQIAPGQLITLPTTDNSGNNLANGLYYVEIYTTQGLYTPERTTIKWLIFR